MVTALNAVAIEAGKLITTAREEGRDITDTELFNLRMKRKAAVEDFLHD